MEDNMVTRAISGFASAVAGLLESASDLVTGTIAMITANEMMMFLIVGVGILAFLNW
jgi:hypothetical protein